MLAVPKRSEGSNAELRSEEIGNRRVALVENGTERYSVTIAVRGPHGTWEDISLKSDQNLGLHTAGLCYRLRRTEQEGRAIAWGKIERLWLINRAFNAPAPHSDRIERVWPRRTRTS